MLAAAADRLGRGRLLIVTVAGSCRAILATAFAQTAAQFALAQACVRVFAAADLGAEESEQGHDPGHGRRRRRPELEAGEPQHRW